MIRIANGQGFWGDSLEAPVEQVRRGPIDYLTLDYLAEVTMSILQKQRARDPKTGYARDFVDMIARVLPDLKERRIRVIANAGGVNPKACCDAVLEAAKRQGINSARGHRRRRRHSPPPGRISRPRRGIEEHGDRRAALRHPQRKCRAPMSTSARSRLPRRWTRALRS